jgi:hypothetical protein
MLLVVDPDQGLPGDQHEHLVLNGASGVLALMRALRVLPGAI